MRRVLRYAVPLDDKPHEVAEGKVALCAARESRTPELWIDVHSDQPMMRVVQAYGTGHVVPRGAIHLGSCLDGPFVWHLYDLSAVDE